MSRLIRRGRLFVAIWRRYLMVKLLMARRRPLPVIVAALSRSPIRRRSWGQSPAQLGRSVVRALSAGRLQPRCLSLALVHYGLLQAEGTGGELVIGLPANPASPRAHAWIELGGVDIGPPPGRHGHEEMARFGGPSPR